MILLAGFRSIDVGTDTGNYVGIFKQINGEGIKGGNNSSLEYFYIILNRIAGLFSENYISLLLCIGIVTIYFNVKVIKNLSINLWLSIFTFFTLGSYVCFFNGARQSIAVAIFGMAIIQIKKKNFKFFLFWIIIASFFHKTVFAMLPVYFILNAKFSFKKTIFIGIVFSLLLVYMSSLLSLMSGGLSQKYGAYDGRGATGAYLLTFFYIMITGIVLYSKKFILEKFQKDYNFYLNICVFHTLTYIVVQISGADINLIRLSFYFQFGFILIYPILFKSIKLFNSLFIRVLFLGIHLVFYYVFLDRMSNLMPYSLNPILNL